MQVVIAGWIEARLRFGDRRGGAKQGKRKSARRGVRHADTIKPKEGIRGTKRAESGMRPERSGAHPEEMRGGQRKRDRIGNDVREDWSKKKVRTAHMADRTGSVFQGHAVDVADWMAPTVRIQTSDMEDRMEKTDRAGKEPARRSGTGKAEDPVDHRRRNLSHFPSWHIPVDVRFGGGGCREVFRP